MTPTEQDKELRESTRKSIALLVAQRRGAVKWDEQDYISAGNILFVCTKLITAYRERVALEARIDERQMLSFHRAYGKDYQATLETLEESNDKRIAELKAQQEEV